MERRAIDVHGTVQGVGFRPFVHALATRLGLAGFVTNTGSAVSIEIEGDRDALNAFERDLRTSAPTLAHIESVTVRSVAPVGEPGFQIAVSRTAGVVALSIPADVATCAACLVELFDPTDRRYRYPFTTCSDCGPRLTIVTGAPYDRAQTTMVGFAMCDACRREYTNPSDRRFHAETIACPACGPRLQALDPSRRVVDGDPLAVAAALIRAGGIVALKGLGGFHLACDAANSDSVAALRTRKHRDEKPFAIMLRDLHAVRDLCAVSDRECELLASPARPIVLLRRRTPRSAEIAPSVAPDVDRLGVMLPYTPTHHLLVDLIGDRPLVMTSGNRSDEPIATDNDDARSRLAGIADLFLVHDRAIHVRCDDSVVEDMGSSTLFVRRSRGYVPAPVRLPVEIDEPVLAVGGQLKNTFAIARGHHAYLSHHIGDLDDLRALAAYERDIELFQSLLAVRPQVIAYDLHPDYASTRLALESDARVRVAVQHHHAHVASCIAEHGLDGPVIGIAWDGAGWGTDECVWGGEFLVGDCRRVERAAHLRYVPLPGGDRATREPWRMAFSHALDAGIDPFVAVPASIPKAAASIVRQMIERGTNAPLASSVGRLFDAVASFAGVRHISTYEGQAAMQLQALASERGDTGTYEFDVEPGTPRRVDTRPLIRAIVADVVAGRAPSVIARRFHSTLAAAAVRVCEDIRTARRLNTVVLTGGVFANAVLSVEVTRRLACEGFEVYRHRTVPPGDGGLSLGQLAVAAAVMKEGR